MFIRKVYFDLTSGEVVAAFSANGNVLRTTKEDDLLIYPKIASYPDEKLGVLIWSEPDQDVEQQFSVATKISVDITSNPYKMVFAFDPIESETIDATTMEAALNELGVITRE